MRLIKITGYMFLTYLQNVFEKRCPHIIGNLKIALFLFFVFIFVFVLFCFVFCIDCFLFCCLKAWVAYCCFSFEKLEKNASLIVSEYASGNKLEVDIVFFCFIFSFILYFRHNKFQLRL